MPKSRPQPPRPDRRRSIRGSFSWIDHRFLREGFDQGLTRLEKLLYFVLVAVSNQRSQLLLRRASGGVVGHPFSPRTGSGSQRTGGPGPDCL